VPAQTTTLDYADAPLAIRPEFGAAHTRFWRRLARPGTWWTADERIAIAAESRGAASCSLCAQRLEALSPAHVRGEHDRNSDLPEAVVDAIHRLVTDASRLSREWYEDLAANGLGDAAYVEIVGTVVAMVSIDSFCRARPLPTKPGSHWSPRTTRGRRRPTCGRRIGPGT
jgi:hypothetical protein